jgi:predicted permease
MLDILVVTGPIFVTLLAGWAAVRFGLFSQDDMRVFGRFVLNLALPCLLFNAVAPQRIDDILNPTYLAAYAVGSLSALALGYAWSRRVSRLDAAAATYAAMGVSCANSGYVGFPILLLTLPAVAGGALALNMVVENLLMIPLLLALAERAGSAPVRTRDVVTQSLRRLIRNPLIVALALAVAFAVAGWRLPAPAARTVTLFAQASSALSLFVIGGTLAAVSLRGTSRQIAPIVVGKLIVHPLLVALALWLAVAAGLPSLSPSLAHAAVLMAGMPMMGIYPLLAQRHGQERMAAAAMLGATAGAFFTLNALLWALAH